MSKTVETREYRVRTAWGRFGVRFREGKLCRLLFPGAQARGPELNGQEGAVGRMLAEALNAYLAGELKRFNLALDLSDGTEFQQRVWRELMRIPWGRVRTYGWVARRLERRGAARAVGAACGRNPLPIVVPCHRVIAASGALCGFSAPGGLDLKRRLLETEGVDA